MKKILSGAMASVLLVGILMASAGCNTKVKREHEVIKETDTWYSCNEIDIAAGCNVLNYEHFTFTSTEVIDDFIVVTYNAYDDMVLDEPHDPICIFDSEGNLLKEFELADELPMSRQLGLVEEGGKMVLYYQSQGKLYKADFIVAHNGTITLTYFSHR